MPLMREREGVTDVDDDGDFLGEGQGRARAHARLERLALDVLHRDVRLAVVFAEVEDRDDVLVREPAGGTRLTEEALAVLGLIHQLGRDDLDGDVPLDWGSKARYTTPIPPWPRRSRIW